MTAAAIRRAYSEHALDRLPSLQCALENQAGELQALIIDYKVQNNANITLKYTYSH